MSPAQVGVSPHSLRAPRLDAGEDGFAGTDPSSPSPSIRALLIDRHFLTLELAGRGSICCPITEEAVEREMRFWDEERIWEVAS